MISVFKNKMSYALNRTIRIEIKNDFLHLLENNSLGVPGNLSLPNSFVPL